MVGAVNLVSVGNRIPVRARFFAEWSLVMILAGVFFGFFIIFSKVESEIFTALSAFANSDATTTMNYMDAMWPVPFVLVVLGMVVWAFAHSTKKEVDSVSFD